SPIRKERRNAKPRACGSGVKPSCLMTSAMRARVSSRTNGDSLMTRETVFFDTFASRATSLIVGRFSSETERAIEAGARGWRCGAARRAAFLACFLAMQFLIEGHFAVP